MTNDNNIYIYIYIYIYAQVTCYFKTAPDTDFASLNI
jgi:hypothetical protein